MNLKNVRTYIRYLIERRSEEEDNTLSKEIIYCLSSGEFGEYSANIWANKRLKKPSTSVALLTYIDSNSLNKFTFIRSFTQAFNIS